MIIIFNKTSVVLQKTSKLFFVDPTIEDSYRKRVCVDGVPLLYGKFSKYTWMKNINRYFQIFWIQ